MTHYAKCMLLASHYWTVMRTYVTGDSSDIFECRKGLTVGIASRLLVVYVLRCLLLLYGTQASRSVLWVRLTGCDTLHIVCLIKPHHIVISYYLAFFHL